MKKTNKLIYVVLALFSLGMLIVACDDDVEDLGKKEKPVLTANGPTDITVSEGSDAVLKFKLNKAISEPIQYRIVILNEGSTATDQDDYVIPGCRSNDPDCVAIEENGGPVGYIFEIPEFTTEYEVPISAIFDDANEVPETLKVQVISNRTLLGTVQDLFFNITINNSASDDLNIRLDWSGTFTEGADELDNCTELDMDLELYNAGGSVILFSYSDCPEGIVLDASTLANGTYTLFASLWTTNGHDENVNIPANITFIKPGTDLNVTNDISSFFPMEDGGLDDGNPNAGVIYTIIKTGTNFQVIDSNNATVFNGKQTAVIKSSRKKTKR